MKVELFSAIVFFAFFSSVAAYAAANVPPPLTLTLKCSYVTDSGDENVVGNVSDGLQFSKLDRNVVLLQVNNASLELINVDREDVRISDPSGVFDGISFSLVEWSASQQGAWEYKFWASGSSKDTSPDLVVSELPSSAKNNIEKRGEMNMFSYFGSSKAIPKIGRCFGVFTSRTNADLILSDFVALRNSK